MQAIAGVHKESGFRLDTRNLVMSGLEVELAKMEEQLRNSPFQVTRLPALRDYSQIPDVLHVEGNGSHVYLLKTSDIAGVGIGYLDPAQAREWFKDLDTVLAITQATFDGGSIATGTCEIKVYGQYAGMFDPAQ